MLVSPISREALIKIVATLPSAPQVLAQLGRLLLDMDADLSDLIALVKNDKMLTVRILRIANSPAYNTGQPFSVVDEALICVGFNQIYRLTGFAAAAQFAEQKLDFYGLDGRRLRENSLFTALMMEALARPAKIEPRLAYTAGLLRSTGKLALERVANEASATGFQDRPGDDAPALGDWEMTFAGMNNCEAAAVVLGEWRFPSPMVNAVRDHYLLEPETASPLAYLLNVAAASADRCGYGVPGEGRYWSLTPEKRAAIALDDQQIEDAVERALDNFATVRSAVS
jgi:HD-like signal output (HDOD) protein